MGTSLRSDIGKAVKARLETVKSSNGYPIDLKAVYYDDIPMGMELAPEQLPAVLLLDDGQNHKHLHGAIEVQWSLRIQIFDVETSTDERMNLILRNIAKGLWANSPTATVMDQFRSIHPSIYQLESLGDETDLHMIEGNRVATARVIVHYRTKPFLL
jgi:hypothetical protein